jgi:hypothetical protein
VLAHLGTPQGWEWTLIFLFFYGIPTALLVVLVVWLVKRTSRQSSFERQNPARGRAGVDH